MKTKKEETGSGLTARLIEIRYPKCTGCDSRGPLPLVTPKGGGFPEPIPSRSTLKWYAAHRDHARQYKGGAVFESATLLSARAPR